MVNNIQLTNQQKLQQEKINAYIKSLEDALAPGGSDIKLDENLHNTLAGVFDAFDASGDGQFSANETQDLVNHLKNLNSDENIATIFDANGNLHLDAGGIDIDNNGNAGGQDDFVALSNMLSSKASVDYAESVMTGKGSKITLENGKQVSHGLGKHAVTFTTKGGYHIVTDTNNGGHQTKIFGADGKMLTHVSGDPHVNEGDSTKNKGWDWHFGDDSTFILDDGTEILFNTTGNASNNVYVTRGLYIISDDDVYQTGLDISDTGSRNSELTKLEMSAIEFDATIADAKLEDDGADTFVYSKEANNGKGGWAVLTDDGTFEDVAYESWNKYKKGAQDGVSQTFDNQTVDTGNAVNASITLEQKEAALDGEAVRIYDRLEKAGATDNQKEAFFDYYFEEGANEALLNAFNTLVDKNGTDAQFAKLDDYIKNPTDIGVDLSSEQEANYLVYLITDEALADMYLDLINKTNEVNTPDVFALNEAKLELFEDATLGGNALNASQAGKMLEYADQDMEIAEAYVDLIQGGADESKVTIFENYLDKFEGVTSEELDKFVDGLNDADNEELDYIDRLVSDENSSKALLDFALDIFDDPLSVNLSERGVSHLLVAEEYGFDQPDLFMDLLNYQTDKVKDLEGYSKIPSDNSMLIESLDEAIANTSKVNDLLSPDKQENVQEAIDLLANHGNAGLRAMSESIDNFYSKFVEGKFGSDERMDFLVDLLNSVGEVNLDGLSEEDQIAELADVIYVTLEEAKDEHPTTGIRYTNLQENVVPFSATAGLNQEEQINVDTNILDGLKNSDEKDHKRIAELASAMMKNDENFFVIAEDIVNSEDDNDDVAEAMAEALIDEYQNRIKAEYNKEKPSTSKLQSWEARIAELEAILD